MTKEEAIYCMTTYLPNSDHSIYDCPKCKYYKSSCKSSEAHKLAIKALRQELLKGGTGMTREEAIEVLQQDIPCEQDTDLIEAIEIAIKALEQEPSEDAISREDAIKQCGFGMTSLLIADCLRRLPPVKPQVQTGHWIVNEWGNISCSECGCTALYDKVYPGESVFGKAIRVKSTFCPTCGAKMG